MGGKFGDGAHIANILQGLVDTDVGIGGIDNFVEPFCGAMGVQIHMTEFCLEKDINMFASDGAPDMIKLWEGMVDGTFKCPPEESITKELWDRLKDDTNPSALRAYVGQGYAYSAIFFGTFVKAANKGDNLYDSLKCQAAFLKNTTLRHCDYRNALDGVEGRCLIYCDPPYEKSSYKSPSSIPINHQEFKQQVLKWKAQGHIVVVSETECDYAEETLVIKKSHCSFKKGQQYSDCLFRI